MPSVASRWDFHTTFSPTKWPAASPMAACGTGSTPDDGTSQAALWCAFGRSDNAPLGARSEARLNDAPVHSQRCPVRPGRKGAADVRHQTRHFVSLQESFEQRRRSHRLKELLLELRERFAAADLVDELI